MAKQCSECSSVAEDQAPYCEGCGGQTWRKPGSESAQRQHYVVAVIILALLLAVYLRFVKS